MAEKTVTEFSKESGSRITVLGDISNKRKRKRGDEEPKQRKRKNHRKCEVTSCHRFFRSPKTKGHYFCTAHGGGRRCKYAGCTKSARGLTNLCIAHGGGNRCIEPGCTQSAVGQTNLCVVHGGGNRCIAPGCTKSAVGPTNLCVAHGGGRRCMEPGCTKSAQGSTNLCIAHGGGRRCIEPGCTKFARGPTNLCIAHGGGRRCMEPGCTKSAQGSTNLCVAHGGGNCCIELGCTKSARGSTNLCVAHGGGNCCIEPGCTKSARGSTNLCVAHGAYPCVNCGLGSVTYLDPRRKLCHACYCIKYNYVPKRAKTREKRFHDLIQARFTGIEFSYNKSQPTLCKQIRYPDWSKDFGSHLFIIECDERQHRHGKNYSCETKRTVQIYDNAAHRPVVFIRFNPDAYTNTVGVKVQGCFKEERNKENGGKDLVVRTKELDRRWKIIEREIKTFTEHPEQVPTKAITVIKLFYDGYEH